MLTYIYHICIRPAIICLIVLAADYALAAPPTAASIERSQEILQEDKALRQRIEQGEKFFVKTIICKGCLRFSEEEIKNIAAPFQGRWMAKEDIRQIMDSLKSAYEKKGIPPDRVNVSYELKKDSILEITVVLS
jgi:outer membrane protein assembly factor BamA